MLPHFAGRDPMICGFASTEPGCVSATSAVATTSTAATASAAASTGRASAPPRTGGWWLRRTTSTAAGTAYFIVKHSDGFRTVQRYQPVGTKLLDYGLNEIDAVVPAYRRIQAEDRNLSAMVEMLMPPRCA